MPSKIHAQNQKLCTQHQYQDGAPGYQKSRLASIIWRLKQVGFDGVQAAPRSKDLRRIRGLRH